MSTYSAKFKEVFTLRVAPVPRKHSPSKSCRCFLKFCILAASVSSPLSFLTQALMTGLCVFEHFPPILFWKISRLQKSWKNSERNTVYTVYLYSLSINLWPQWLSLSLDVSLNLALIHQRYHVPSMCPCLYCLWCYIYFLNAASQHNTFWKKNTKKNIRELCLNIFFKFKNCCLELIFRL